MWLHCKEANLISLRVQPVLPRKKQCLPHSYKACGHHPQQETVEVSPAKSPSHPPELSCVGGREWLKTGTKCETLKEAIVWDQDEVLSPLLLDGPVSSPTGDSFD